MEVLFTLLAGLIKDVGIFGTIVVITGAIGGPIILLYARTAAANAKRHAETDARIQTAEALAQEAAIATRKQMDAIAKEALEDRNKTLQDLAAVQQSNAELQQKLFDVSLELTKIKTESEQNLIHYKAIIDDLLKRLDVTEALRTKNQKTFSMEIVNLNKRIDELEKQLIEKEHQRKELERLLNESRSQLEKERLEWETKLAKRVEELETLRGEIDKLKLRIGELENGSPSK